MTKLIRGIKEVLNNCFINKFEYEHLSGKDDLIHRPTYAKIELIIKCDTQEELDKLHNKLHKLHKNGDLEAVICIIDKDKFAIVEDFKTTTSK